MEVNCFGSSFKPPGVELAQFRPPLEQLVPGFVLNPLAVVVLHGPAACEARSLGLSCLQVKHAAATCVLRQFQFSEFRFETSDLGFDRLMDLRNSAAWRLRTSP